MKVYVIHQLPWSERRRKIEDLLSECRSVGAIEFITSEKGDAKFATPTDNNVDSLPEGFPWHLTTDTERSVWYKHFEALRKIAESNEPAIILEDDALFNPEDMDKFIKACDNMPQDLDWCFFGTCLKMQIPGEGFVQNNNRLKSKCADSMLINNMAARIVFNEISSNKIHMAIDWELNRIFMKFNLSVYWYEPGFVIQGSENGTYPCGHNR